MVENLPAGPAAAGPSAGSLPGPSLDISVVTHHSSRWLDGFMRSLLAQALPVAAIRLLVRDNGSTDDTRAVWDRWRAQVGDRFAAFELDWGDNVGFGRGHNANLARATTPWILVSNVDLEFEPQTLVMLLGRAQSANARVASWECRQKPYEHPKHYHPATGETLWSSSACVLLRVEAMREVGGYEPRFFLYGEDVELSYRLRDHGWQLHYVPRAVVWHYTYQHAAELKPEQFVGSTLANALIRLRYGTRAEASQGLLMYVALLAVPQRFPGQRRRLIQGGLKLLKLAPHFWRTRARSAGPFPFRLWDYEFTRHGGFHEAVRRDLGPWEDRPRVSVIVRTMAGRRGRLLEAVASVAQQSWRNVELVIVEDGSDTVRDLVQAWAENGEFAAVRYEALPRCGRCEAGNAGLAIATGAYLGFLDDDDLLYGDHVETLVDAIEARPELGAVYSLAYEVRTEVTSLEPWVYTEVAHSLVHREPFNRAVLWHHNYMPIQAVLFRRELFEEYGGFDPELDQLEDWNLWVRYSLHRDFAMVEKVTSLYRVPACPDDAADRQRALDDYYAKAVAKHGQLQLALNPNEVVVLAQGYARQTGVVVRPAVPVTTAQPMAGLRRFVLRTPGLRLMYPLLRRLYLMLRRLRGY
jgi:GT2 family glycosyltransferase